MEDVWQFQIFAQITQIFRGTFVNTNFPMEIRELRIFSLQSPTQFSYFDRKLKFKNFFTLYLGRGASFESVPFYWTVHYGRSVRVVGHYTAGGGGEDENIDVQQAALWNRY
jgi:hypothetical protein